MINKHNLSDELKLKLLSPRVENSLILLKEGY